MVFIIGIIVIWIVIFLVIVILGLKQVGNRKKVVNIAEENISLNSPPKNRFIENKSYFGYDNESKIAIDTKNRNVCIWKNKMDNSLKFSASNSDYDFEYSIFKYEDILSVEIFKDGKSVTKTSRGSQLGGAVIGGVLAGGVGAIIGGLSGDTIVEDITSRIDLYITVNDINNPIYIINFFKKGDSFYKLVNEDKAYLNCKEWFSLLTHIIKVDNTIENKVVSDIEKDGIVKLRELKQLFDDGVITDEEFKEQKNKILSKISTSN